MTAYERPAGGTDALRLHLNENTGGCSPAVLAAIRSVTTREIALYPDYERVTARCARHLGVRTDEVILTNGLDEALLIAAVIAFRQTEPGAEAIVVEPAFDMYAISTVAAGGRVRPILPRAGFAFPLDEIRAAITPRTRLVFLTNPNNPTGLTIPHDAIAAVAAAAGDALVFLDEAYVDFGGDTYVREALASRNVIVGRTFAKAYGLAGLRAGAVVAPAVVLAPFRDALPPYSLNALASVALEAALDDREYTARYLADVQASKQALYGALDRLGYRYWRSAANFVLVHVGDRAGDIVAGLAARGVLVRDRSSQPGCDGCIRITTGVLTHTMTCIEALEASS